MGSVRVARKSHVAVPVVAGDDSELHIIIFDEIDAICKQRGSGKDGTGVGDTVVNQMLSKMDGVTAINNILIVTPLTPNRKLDRVVALAGSRITIRVSWSLKVRDGAGRHDQPEGHDRRGAAAPGAFRGAHRNRPA